MTTTEARTTGQGREEQALGILVTGSSGYIGGRLVAYLAEQRGLSIRAVTRLPAPCPRSNVEMASFDLLGDTGPKRLEDACEGMDAVVHLAGPNEVLAARDPERAICETIRLAQRVASAASEAGIKRVVYLSTVHVYGDALVSDAVITEDVVPAPRHPYAIGRLASEHLVGSAIPGAVILRLTNAVGAPLAATVDRWSLVANDLCRQAVLSGSLRLRTSGTQWRDFVALTDVCSILAAAANALEPRIPPGVYNLASGRTRTVRGLAEEIQERFGAMSGQHPTLIAPPPEPDPPGAYTVATGRLDGTGWHANTPLSAAIDETISFCLEHGRELGSSGEEVSARG